MTMGDWLKEHSCILAPSHILGRAKIGDRLTSAELGPNLIPLGNAVFRDALGLKSGQRILGRVNQRVILQGGIKQRDGPFYYAGIPNIGTFNRGHLRVKQMINKGMRVDGVQSAGRDAPIVNPQDRALFGNNIFHPCAFGPDLRRIAVSTND